MIEIFEKVDGLDGYSVGNHGTVLYTKNGICKKYSKEEGEEILLTEAIKKKVKEQMAKKSKGTIKIRWRKK